MGLVLLGGAFWKWREQRRETATEREDDGRPVFRNPFALLPAIKWALLLCGVLLLATGAQELLGERGLLLAAAASGLADVDAINIAVSQQAADGALAVEIATLAVAIAIAANTLVKGGLAWIGGGRAFGAPIAAVFAAAMAAGALLALYPLLV
jgi:uncharacterized membrane protein (DUF4010 family)